MKRSSGREYRMRPTTTTGERPLVYSEEQIRRTNAYDHRHSLTGPQLQAYIVMEVSRWGVDAAAKCLQEYCRGHGLTKEYRMLRVANGMVHNAMHNIAEKVDVGQLIAIHNELCDATLYVTAEKISASDLQISVQRDALFEIIKASLDQCGATCTKTAGQCKACKLRRAYSRIPGMAEGARDQQLQLGICPFQSYSVETSEEWNNE